MSLYGEPFHLYLYIYTMFHLSYVMIGFRSGDEQKRSTEKTQLIKFSFTGFQKLQSSPLS